MEPEIEPQNVYDDPQFSAGYSRLDRFQSGWGGGMEHESFLQLLGDVSGRRVLDLGCGGGQLAFHLAEAGASEVVGIDASARMLEVARTQFAHTRVIYRQAAMEEAEFSIREFDVVVSSLAFHYVQDYGGLMRPP
jgi:2-polyprenyl-3-methyl-5-hydroxy-6-metoxy-1,4-benzoquinol methylase